MKNIKLYLIAILASFSTLSCLVDDEIEVNDQNYNGSKIVGFKSDVTLGNFVQQAGATFDFNVPVHQLGGGAGQPIGSVVTMSYELGALTDLPLSADEIADIQANQVEGIEGTHYDFLDTVRETVIPANHSFDLIPLDVYNDALDGGKTTYFVLNLRTLVTVEDVVISDQLKSTLVQIQLCRTDLAGDYTVQYGSGPFTHTVTSLGGGDYELSSMFGWPTSGYTSYFYACAGELVFTEWVFSNEIIQGIPGYVDGSGNLVFEQFGIENVYAGRTYTMIP